MNDRKQRVLVNAQQLFLEKGFVATSVQDILDKARISKGTFYNYFSSKNECLMAILTHAHDVASARRQELLIGKDRSDKDVFIKQIAVRVEVNREHQLIPLFEAIFHSKDRELREFVIRHHLIELSWISQRLVEVYGRDAAPYTIDCAIMIMGMIKHFTNVWMTGLREEVDTNKLIHFVVRRIDSIISDMIREEDKLLGDRIALPAKEIDSWSKKAVLEKLQKLYQSLEENHEGKEYIDFLLDEIRSEKPRSSLLETVLRDFGKKFNDSPVEIEAKELAFQIYTWMETKKKQKTVSP